MNDNVEESFIRLLLTDVIDAMHRHEHSPTQAAKRDLIRTTFAAVEGFVWIFRTHVVEAARTTSEITPEEEIVLSEVSYHVTDRGGIKDQTKFIPILSVFRLVARIAERMSPEARIDLAGREWESLKVAVKIRHRITHPKSADDLRLTEEDARICVASLFWFSQVTTTAMEAANMAIKDYLGTLDELLKQLQSGNPATLAAYEGAGRFLRDNEP